MSVLAKSEKNGGLTLYDHTAQVVEAAEQMAAVLGFDVALARKGAVLHDLGKAHPYFQRVLRNEVDPLERPFPHRHELSSLLLLPLFQREIWPDLIDMVVAHHKSVKKDRSGRGLIDLIREYGKERVFDRHAEAWEAWMPQAIEVAAAFGVVADPISRSDACGAFEVAVDHVRSRPDGWSRWKGLLMSADHFASAHTHDTTARLATLYRVPNMEGYRGASEKYQPSPLYPLSLLSPDDPRLNTLVVAPTGAGKTNFLMARCRGRIFYTLPYQASINAMYLRFMKDFEAYGETVDVRRVHGSSTLALTEDPDEDVEMQRHPGAGVKVMTPYQIASIVFGTAGFEAQALDLEGQDIILDEVHTYDGLSRAMMIQMVRMLRLLGCRVHIGTATIASALADRLLDELGGTEAVQIMRLPSEKLDDFDRHHIHKLADEEAAFEVLAQALRKGRRMLFVSNRVAHAQNRFRHICTAFPQVPSMLIHSRYKRGDRNALEDQVRAFEKQQGPSVVCATQVVEVSLDISFDGMITDAAPLDALIQRFGRVNRRRPSNRIDPIWVIAPPDEDRAILPYEADVVRRSFEALPSNAVLREREVQQRIDRVYPEVTVPRMDLHFIFDDEGYTLSELQHKPRSELVNALEIDGAVCILASDVARYRAGDAEVRQRLHIPVPESYRARFGWPMLDWGSRPLIVPDACYNSGGLSVGLVPDTDPGTSFSDRAL